MKHQGSSFLSGCAPFSDFIFFSKMNDEMAAAGTVNSSFFVMDKDEWLKYGESVPWPALDMETLKLKDAGRIIAAIGPQGEYWELDDDTVKERMGVIAADAPTMRALARIDDVIYACGMGRRVYRRLAPGEWRAMGPNVPLPEGFTVVGFEAMCGFSEKEIYAVGWLGEIWRFDQTRWSQIDSPVSATLHGVTCASDGIAYAVGAAGVMVRGRGDDWSVLDTQRTENLMDVAELDGTIYVATDFRILKLAGNVLVEETDFADPNDRPASCLHLLTGEDGLISMGPGDVFRRAGGPWERLI
jgi:hypothetical protein